jgi:hypothetical protein
VRRTAGFACQAARSWSCGVSHCARCDSRRRRPVARSSAFSRRISFRARSGSFSAPRDWAAPGLRGRALRAAPVDLPVGRGARLPRCRRRRKRLTRADARPARDSPRTPVEVRHVPLPTGSVIAPSRDPSCRTETEPLQRFRSHMATRRLQEPVRGAATPLSHRVRPSTAAVSEDWVRGPSHPGTSESRCKGRDSRSFEAALVSGDGGN